MLDWDKYIKVANKFQHKARREDRDDLRQDIILKLAQVELKYDDKVIDLIASGYNKRVLPYAWLALISGLAGIELEIEEPEPVPQRLSSDLALAETEKIIGDVKNKLKDPGCLCGKTCQKLCARFKSVGHIYL